MTIPLFLGHAISAPNTDLDALWQTAQNGQATAVQAATNATTALSTVPAPGDERLDASLQDYISHTATLWLGSFGVVGDGVVDDTAAVQAALTAGATHNRVIYGGALVCKISGPLSMAGPGLVFDLCPHGGGGGPGIKVTGTGYTALSSTASSIITALRLTVWGTGNTANGVLLQNPILSHIEQIRVYGLNGFGVKINKIYDSSVGIISVENCGNTSEYAFSINDDGDTSNMSHFGQIKAEVCTAKAIYIAPETLGCTIDNIHSERNVPNPAYFMWVLGGNCCQYTQSRFHSNAPSANAGLYLQGSQTAYTAVIAEDNIPVTLEGILGASITITEPNFRGTARALSSQVGTINLHGGYIESLGGDPLGLRVFGTKFNTLDIGDAGNDPSRGRFFGCSIANLASHSTQSAATFVGCAIAEGNSLLRGQTKLIGTTVGSAGGVSHTSGTLELLAGSTLTGSVTYANNAPIRVSGGSAINGTVSRSGGGNTDILVDGSSWIGAASTNVGVPTGGSHVVGQRHVNPIPVVGQPKSWVCTVTGSPGTWVSEGVL